MTLASSCLLPLLLPASTTATSIKQRQSSQKRCNLHIKVAMEHRPRHQLWKPRAVSPLSVWVVPFKYVRSSNGSLCTQPCGSVEILLEFMCQRAPLTRFTVQRQTYKGRCAETYSAKRECCLLSRLQRPNKSVGSVPSFRSSSCFFHPRSSFSCSKVLGYRLAPLTTEQNSSCTALWFLQTKRLRVNISSLAVIIPPRLSWYL